jgi:transcriptional regulator with XRE-family HTH domain
MTKSYFSENLRALRKFKKITLEELADALNVSKSAISDYENDKFSPSIFICRKVADYFGVSIDRMEFSEILENLPNGTKKIVENDSSIKFLTEAREYIQVLEKQKNELLIDINLQKQKVESLKIQLRLQDQLRDSKLSEIELLRTQISLLEDKIEMFR